MDTPTTNPLKDFMINDFYPAIERMNPKYMGIAELAKTDKLTNMLYQQAYEEIMDDLERLRTSNDN